MPYSWFKSIYVLTCTVMNIDVYRFIGYKQTIVDMVYASTAYIKMLSYNSMRTAAEIFQSRPYIRPLSSGRGAPLQLVRTAWVCRRLRINVH